MQGSWNVSSTLKSDSGLSGHSSVEYKGNIYIFGGIDRNGTLNRNLMCFSISTPKII